MAENTGFLQEEFLCKIPILQIVTKSLFYIVIYIMAILQFYRESENGEVWYYSTPLQLEELMYCLDRNEMEVALYRELSDYKDEIVRQMELTESITNQFKGNKKSYLEVENSEYCIY